MTEGNVTPALAGQLERIAGATSEASSLLELHLDRENLVAELLRRLRTITETGEEARRAVVLAALDAGVSVRDTAKAAGIAPATVQRWKAER